ncbi:MAG: cytochrome c [Acidobacteria bacterium]|nr:cytochrome c [Acidobacteriota bacterium]
MVATLRFERVAIALLALTGVLVGDATQAQTVTEGVYTVDQATRGGQVYQDQCATCHGDALEGTVGPPLAGDGFLSIWSARPVVELVDKIQNTMPLQAPVPLSREESIDLGAYILQAGGFPAGPAELTDAALPGIALPVSSAASAAVAGGDVPVAPLANLAQLMRAIAFPASNTVFNVQIRDPGASTPPPTGTRPFDYVEWGATVYPGWEAIDLAALALAESAPLFLAPGRRCENGRPVPVDRADWQEFTEALVEAGRAAYRASQSRSVDAVVGVTDQLNDACDNCHAVYRDAGAEGRGVGADRCRQDP